MNDNPSPETTEAAIASAGAPTAVLTDGQVAGQLARQLEELSNPDWYINRELSWLEFNDRVLQLAQDESLPLIERCKFLAIFTTNLDEFFMVRVAGVHDQVDARIDPRGPDGLSPTEMLEQIAATVREQDRRQAREFSERVRPALAEQGIRILGLDEAEDPDGVIQRLFREQIFPVLTPLAIGPGRPFPYISNLSLSLIVRLHDPEIDAEVFARVKVPKEVLPRFVEISKDTFVPLEDIIAAQPRRAVPRDGHRHLGPVPGDPRRRLRGLRRGRRSAAGGRGRAAPPALRRGRPARGRRLDGPDARART